MSPLKRDEPAAALEDKKKPSLLLFGKNSQGHAKFRACYVRFGGPLAGQHENLHTNLNVNPVHLSGHKRTIVSTFHISTKIMLKKISSSRPSEQNEQEEQHQYRVNTTVRTS